MRKRQFLRHSFRRDSQQQSKDRQYEQFKEMWRVSHPEATPEEYAAAMERIAREIGI